MKQTLKYIYSVIYDDLKYAEAKHTIILTLSGAVLAFATTFLGESTNQNLFAVGSIILALLAILYSFFALISRNIKLKKRNNINVRSLMFYKDIINFNEHTYIDAIKDKYQFTKIYKPDNMDYDLAKQIIVTAKLIYIKFLYFNFSVLFLFASILCLILAVLIRGGIW